MKKIKKLTPFDTIDNPVYRDAYADLRKSRTADGLTYNGFLARMNARNQVLRKQEYDERRIELRHISFNN